MKVLITVKHTETSVADIGDLSPRMVQELLEQGDGSFGDTSWSLGDLPNNKWQVDSIEVVEQRGGKRSL